MVGANRQGDENPTQADRQVSDSRVTGCAIHESFNRAVNCHACDGLLVEGNVVYKNLGHSFFVEDGLEEGNVFRRNLGILTMRSMSLLESDQTPSTFWITNLNNTLEGNVAAGSHSYVLGRKSRPGAATGMRSAQASARPGAAPTPSGPQLIHN